MKVQLSTTDFKNMLKVMDKIKDKELNQTTDLLTIADNRQTKLIKSNSETTIIYSIDGWTQENGNITLPNQSAELIKKLKEDYFTLTDEAIKTDKKQVSFSKLDNIEINTYENIEKIFTVTQRELLRMLSVTYALANENSRPILTGVIFNKAETCALDGYRMSVRASEQYNNEHSFIVNQFSIGILKSILKESDDIVNVFYDNKDNNGIVKFEVGNITIIAKCLNGEFINYKQIIGINNCNIKAIVNSNELAEEIDFIKSADGRSYLKTIFTKDKIILKGNQCKEVYSEKKSSDGLEERQKPLDYEYKEKYLEWKNKKQKAEAKGSQFKTKEPKRKEAKFKKLYDLIPVNDIISEISSNNDLDGKDKFEIAYNPIYMADGLKQYSGSVELRMSSSVNPIYVTNDGKNLELILPIRIKE